MPQIGPLEIAVVLLVALLVFGPHRMPDLARQAGRAMRELRRIQQNLRADLNEFVAEEPTGMAPAPTLPPKATADPAAPDPATDATGAPPDAVDTAPAGEPEAAPGAAPDAAPVAAPDAAPTDEPRTPGA